MYRPYTLTFFLLVWMSGFPCQLTYGQLLDDLDLSGAPCTQCDPDASRIGGSLLLLEDALLNGNQAAWDFIPTCIQVQGQLVNVNVTLRAPYPEAVEALQTAGMERPSQVKYMVSGWVPIERLRTLAHLPEVAFVHAALAPLTLTGSVTNQGDSAQRSHIGRANYSVDGSGVKIGILSDSYNTLGGATAGCTSGDLPGIGNPLGRTTPVQVLSEYTQTATDEGRAIAELVHDVVPGAELAFATAFGGQATFANNILSLEAAGCDLIVEDVRYFASPFFQDGVIAQAADSVVRQGVGFYSAAGNQGDKGYQAAYNSSYLNATYDVHLFGTNDFLQRVTLGPQSSVIVVLQWDNPFSSVSGPTNGPTADLDLYLLYNGGVIASSTDVNVGGGDPVEIIQVSNNSTTGSAGVDLLVATNRSLTTANPGTVAYVMYTTGTVTIDEYATQSPTCYGQSNAEGVAAIGAAYWRDTPYYGQNPPLKESFSSKGGMPILFDPDGSRIPSITRATPLLVGPDGFNTTFFGTEITDDPDTYPNFFGTSASVGMVAAVHALMKELVPFATVDEIQQVLAQTAIDMETAGFDDQTGHGFIDAEAALDRIAISFPVTLQTFDASADATGITLNWAVGVEENLQGYEIEIASPDQPFEAAGFVPASGAHLYSYQLPKQTPNQYFLRLKMLDVDGAFQYSPIVEVNMREGTDPWRVKQASGQLLAYPPHTVSEFTCQIWSVEGKFIHSTRMRASGQAVKLMSLPASHPPIAYRLRWEEEGKVHEQKGVIR